MDTKKIDTGAVPETAATESDDRVSGLGRSLLSIKQIEAFYWSALLGSFVAASRRLNTTQSNISKRIQELETTLGILAFDRSRRSIRLTQKGEEAMQLSETLLKAHMRLSSVGSTASHLTGRFRLGTTEAVALTWLSQYLSATTSKYPGVIPEPRIATTQELNLALQRREIDLLIGTAADIDPGFATVTLAHIERAVMASPQLGLSGRRLTLEELAQAPTISQTSDSASQRRMLRRMSEIGLEPNVVISCASLSTRARMAIAGIGIAYLPRDVFSADVAAGRLEIVETDLEPMPLHYVAAHRNDAISPVAAILAQVATEYCNFCTAI